MKTFSVILVLVFAPALTMTARASAQSVDSTQANAQHSVDTVYTADQVDEIVRPQKLKSPEYPEELRHRNIRGSVTLRFVVDTSGHADSTSIVITSSANRLFSEASRKAVLKSTFVPAELNGRKVKQIVDQKFTFTIRQ